MDQEYKNLEARIKSLGYFGVDDFIRKNKDKLSEQHLKLLKLINFQFD